LLQHNSLKVIHGNVFVGIQELTYLHLRKLKVERLTECSFCGLESLEHLDLSVNLITTLKQSYFKNLLKLRLLNLSYNSISLAEYGFLSESVSLQQAYFDISRLCCYVPKQSRCAYKTNTANQLSTCSDLLGSHSLKGLVWIEALFIVISNTMVIHLWVKDSHLHQNPSTQMVYYITLALSDLYVGFYLGIIGIADNLYKGKYFSVEDTWQMSIMCRAASSLTIVSATTSTITLFILSIEKLLKFKNPLEPFAMSTNVLTVLLLVVTLFFSAIAILLNATKFPTRSDTCFLVRFETDGKITHDMQYMTSYGMFCILIFIILLLFGLLANNIMSLHYIIKTRKGSGRAVGREDRAMIARTIVVSVSNFMSWVVVVPVASLAVAGHPIHSVTLAWVAIIGLPLNSILNPIIYTFTIPRFKNVVFGRWRRLQKSAQEKPI